MKFLPALQRTRAAAMRTAPTVAERQLWGRLRGGAIGGAKFSRQIAIGPYIADFVARRLLLVIEVDGAQHGGPRDVARQAAIEARGYRVLRFMNREIADNLDGVVFTIAAAIKAIQSAEPAQDPPLAPPVPGGGPAGWGGSPHVEDR